MVSRKIRFILSFAVISIAVYKLIPLLVKGNYIQIPFGLSKTSAFITVSLLLAGILQTLYTRKRTDDGKDKLDRAISFCLAALLYGAVCFFAVRYFLRPACLSRWITMVCGIGVVCTFCGMHGV